MQLIGLFGYPESGKSTIAQHLEHVYGYARCNVGDGMKFMMDGFYRGHGLHEENIVRRLYGDLKEEPDPFLNGKTPRYAMQTLGKEWRDLIGPTFWADRWFDRVTLAGKAVADGMRYPDELPVFRKAGGVLVQVTRPGHRRVGQGHVADDKLMLVEHRACELINDGTPSQLMGAVDILVDNVASGESPPREIRASEVGKG